MLDFNLLKMPTHNPPVIRINPSLIIGQCKKFNILFIAKKITILNNVKKRYLILPPRVAAGLEKELCKNDFDSLEDKYIGRGTFASVWKVQHKKTKQVFAIKVINKESIIQQNMVDQMNKEIEIIYKLDHPHIIKLYHHL